MPRLMSVALTEDAVLTRQKTVTRRNGWWTDRNGKRLLLPGDTLTLCRKVMGRKAGEPLIRLCDVEVLSVRRERLAAITYSDCAREGFPAMQPSEFIAFYCAHMGGDAWQQVTRIEWRYL